jgi:hypothetical protein
MGLWSGGCSPAAAGSCRGGTVLESPFDGGGGVVVTGPLRGSGGGDGHTTNLAYGESGPALLAPSLGARVPVGRPRGPTWIRVVCLYGDLGGVDSGTEMTLTGSSSLSTTVTMTTSSSSSSPVAKGSRCMAVPGDPTGRRLDLRVPSTYRPMDRGKVKEAVQEP